jgi:hypothetical protein
LVALGQPKTNSIVASYFKWSLLDGFQNKKIKANGHDKM